MNRNKNQHFNCALCEAVIFDVDGTLYDQKKLRFRMFVSLVQWLWRNPKSLKIIRIIKVFREHRERMASFDGQVTLESQYRWVSDNTQLDRNFIKEVIETWMFQRPMLYLSDYMFDDVADFFKLLREKGLKIGIFSDYPAMEKLSAMKLFADTFVCSTDSAVQCLKPNPRGLLHCCKKLCVNPEKVVFIGDRDDRDGECARRANVSYLIMPGDSASAKHFYSDLIDRFNDNIHI